MNPCTYTQLIKRDQSGDGGTHGRNKDMDNDFSSNTGIPTGNASRESRQQRVGLQAVIYQLQPASFPDIVTSANHCLTQEPLWPVAPAVTTLR